MENRPSREKLIEALMLENIEFTAGASVRQLRSMYNDLLRSSADNNIDGAFELQRAPSDDEKSELNKSSVENGAAPSATDEKAINFAATPYSADAIMTPKVGVVEKPVSAITAVLSSLSAVNTPPSAATAAMTSSVWESKNRIS